jgi:hypothetical protein
LGLKRRKKQKNGCIVRLMTNVLTIIAFVLLGIRARKKGLIWQVPVGAVVRLKKKLPFRGKKQSLGAITGIKIWRER